MAGQYYERVYGEKYDRKLTKSEFLEFHALKKKLFKGDMFVVMDEQSPDVIRYNELIGKVLG